MDDERVVLVDEHDCELGTADKLEAHREGLLHRALSVFLFDSEGRVLIQRRALDKYHSGGLWANACCSHPRPGEPIADAARRRLREELGIDTTLLPAGTFQYRADVGVGLVEHELDHVFIGHFDGEARPNPAEVDAWRWADVLELRFRLEARDPEFAPWFAPALALALTALTA